MRFPKLDGGFRLHDMEAGVVCAELSDGSFGEFCNTQNSFGDQHRNAEVILAALRGQPRPPHSMAEVIFFRDGHDGNGLDMWCAVRDGFVDLQESHAGFGVSMDAAYANLLESEAA